MQPGFGVVILPGKPQVYFCGLAVAVRVFEWRDTAEAVGIPLPDDGYGLVSGGYGCIERIGFEVEGLVLRAGLVDLNDRGVVAPDIAALNGAAGAALGDQVVGLVVVVEGGGGTDGLLGSSSPVVV